MCKILCLAALLITGCLGGSFDKLPGQDEAVAIVWNQLYEQNDDPPPIEWFTDDHGILFTSEGSEFNGLTLPGWKVQVAIFTQPTICDKNGKKWNCQISISSMCHELMHYRTFLRTGDVDISHTRGDWTLADSDSFYVLQDAGY